MAGQKEEVPKGMADETDFNAPTQGTKRSRSDDGDSVDAPVFKGFRGDTTVTYDSRTMYDFTHSKRGKAVIICFTEYKSDSIAGPRASAINDIENLSAPLKYLGYDVEVLKNKEATTVGVEKKLRAIAQQDHSDASSFLCVISTHGEEELVKNDKRNSGEREIQDQVKMYDGALKVNELTQIFSEKNAHSSLSGKPKLFFIQACRILAVETTSWWGGKSMAMLPQAVDPSANTGKKAKLASEFIKEQTGKEYTLIKEMPMEKDFLLACATPPGYFGLRRGGRGSWFIYELCQMLIKHGSNWDLLRILDAVSQKVATEFTIYAPGQQYDKKKQIPWIASMLRKDLFFNMRQ